MEATAEPSRPDAMREPYRPRWVPPSATAPVRVLIADHNPVLRFGLRSLLERDPAVVVVAEVEGAGTATISKVRNQSPDLVLLGLSSPELGGLAAVADIARLAPILAVSYLDQAEVITQAMLAGVRGYLVYGQFPPADLPCIVRHAVAGQMCLSATAAAALIDRARQADDAPARETAGLTTREREIMDLVANGLSNRAVAYRLAMSAKTVKNHLHHIFERLGVSDRATAATVWLNHSPTNIRGAESDRVSWS